MQNLTVIAARFALGLLCVIYGGAAIMLKTDAVPTSIEWLGKVGALLIVGAVLAVPEIRPVLHAVLAMRPAVNPAPQPTMPGRVIPALPAAPPVPGPPHAVPALPPPGKSCLDEVLREAQIVVELAEYYSNDIVVREKLIDLNHYLMQRRFGEPDPKSPGQPS